MSDNLLNVLNMFERRKQRIAANGQTFRSANFGVVIPQ